MGVHLGGQDHVAQCLVLRHGVLPLLQGDREGVLLPHPQGDRDVFLVTSILRLRPQEVPHHQGVVGGVEVLLLVVKCEFLYWIFQTREAEEDLGLE